MQEYIDNDSILCHAVYANHKLLVGRRVDRSTAMSDAPAQ
jgi:hypothetical protein